jgi:hypothetical protein
MKQHNNCQKKQRSICNVGYSLVKAVAVQASMFGNYFSLLSGTSKCDIVYRRRQIGYRFVGR